MIRKRPTREQQQAAFARYDGRCPRCNAIIAEAYLLGREVRWRVLPGAKIEWNHIQSLEAGGDNATDNFQPLCKKPCHQWETKQQARLRAKVRRIAGKTGSKRRLANREAALTEKIERAKIELARVRRAKEKK